MLYSQSISGSYWSSSKKGLNSYGLDIRDTRLSKTHTANACFGYTLRCVTVPRFFLSTGSLGARSYPLSYVYSGYYYWATGRLYNQTLNGYYWSSSIASSTGSYRLGMDSTRLVKADSANKRNGRAMRCVARLIY